MFTLYVNCDVFFENLPALVYPDLTELIQTMSATSSIGHQECRGDFESDQNCEN